MSQIPKSIAAFAAELAKSHDIDAVVLGGSHAVNTADPESDWDLGVYYRGAIDLSKLASYGEVHPPGSWGRIMNGGAWLDFDGVRVDVLLRDLNTVEHWTRLAEQGKFEVDSLLGYVAGIPSYTLTAELASCRILHGDLPVVSYPTKLIESGPHVWRFCRNFSLDYAYKHAKRGNLVGATAQAARAVVEEAHAIMCERGAWVCNEKRLIESAGLDRIQELFAELPSETAPLTKWLDRIRKTIRQ